jgi:DNA-binding response OmpR family regulator
VRLKSAVMIQTRVLEVEDDPDIARFVALNIGGVDGHPSGIEGCQVTIAEDGEEAIERALALRPHVVLMNRMLPKILGVEATRRLRTHPEMETTQIVMLSAGALSTDVLEALQAGANDYIVKPFDPEDLVIRVRYALHLAQGRVQEPSPRPATVEEAGAYLAGRKAAAYALVARRME